MKLILHIGTAKTGTTTLQHWFASNRESLRSQGIYYLKSLGQVNHSKLYVLAMSRVTSNHYSHKHNISSVEDYQIFKSNSTQDFEQEYAENSNIKTWVISNEHLHSRLTHIEMINQVKQFLWDKFEEIEVLVHLRPQVDIAVSLASTATRVGKAVNSSWFSQQKKADHYYNYDQLIEKWETVFGAEKITILPFKVNPCMTTFLMQKLCINFQNMIPINRKNEAIDWRTMALFNLILDSPQNRKDWQDYQKFIKHLPCTEKLSIGLDIAQEFQSQFQSSNAQLIARRQELNSDDLTPDWNKYDVPANLHYLDSDPVFTEPLNALVRGLNWEIKLEKCNTKLAKCEVALAQNQLKKARQFLDQAEKIGSQLSEDEMINPRLGQITKRIKRLNQQVR
jgi:hypothetical protein